MLTETAALLTGIAMIFPTVGTASLLYDVRTKVNEAVTEKETDPDLELVSKIVLLEAGGESTECQRAVAEVIYNRLQSEIWGDTVEEVIFSKANGCHEFESVYYLDNAALDEDIYTIVSDVWENGSEIDSRIMWFRADYYHTWATDEFSIDNTYFSSSPWLK